MRNPTAEFFATTTWWTPNQIRDSFFDCSDSLTTDFINMVRNLAIREQAKRKKSPDFVECPICKGFHGQITNIDNLCEKHEAETAPLRYDSKHE
jgi:hypothetical protein